MLPEGYEPLEVGGTRGAFHAALRAAVAASGVLDGADPASVGREIAQVGGGRRPLSLRRLPGGGVEVLVKTLRRGGVLGPLLRGDGGAERWLRELAVTERARRGGVRAPAIWLAVRHRAEDGRARTVLWVAPIAGASDYAAVLRDAAPRARARALAAAGAEVGRLHRAGVEHEDLNLRNLLLSADGAAAIVDFGASRARTGAASTRSVVRALSRLYRSVVKRKLDARLTRSDVARFVRAHEAPGEWRWLHRRVTAALRVRLPLHRASWWVQRRWGAARGRAARGPSAGGPSVR